MIYHFPIEKDNYITNKIIMNSRRATDANLGHASTLDLFKLYNENLMKNESGNIIEHSHLLVQADLDALKTKLDVLVDTAVDSLKVRLVLKDVQGTQIAPKNFSIDLVQLEENWNEGFGSDIAQLKDLDASNWVSATTDSNWTNAGAVPSAPVIISSQSFDSGTEDLEIDITQWVKDVWDGTVANKGWLLKLSDAMIADEYSYFVKRFSSRHSRNPYQKPMLVVTWDDHHQDDRLQFELNVENSVAIKHFVKGIPSDLGVVTCTISNDTWSLDATTVSNVSIGAITQLGWYQADFRAINLQTTDVDLATSFTGVDEITLIETWLSDGVVFATNTLTLKKNLSLTTSRARDYRISLMEMKEKYTHDETPVIRLFVRDKRLDNEPVRKPIELPSQRLDSAWYRIKDYGNRSEPVVDFSYPENWSKLSTDATGMYFTLPTQILPSGRTFSIDIMYIDRSKTYVWESKTAFRVEGE